MLNSVNPVNENNGVHYRANARSCSTTTIGIAIGSDNLVNTNTTNNNKHAADSPPPHHIHISSNGEHRVRGRRKIKERARLCHKQQRICLIVMTITLVVLVIAFCCTLGFLFQMSEPNKHDRWKNLRNNAYNNRLARWNQQQQEQQLKSREELLMSKVSRRSPRNPWSNKHGLVGGSAFWHQGDSPNDQQQLTKFQQWRRLFAGKASEHHDNYQYHRFSTPPIHRFNTTITTNRSSKPYSIHTSIIPFVIMVYDRVDYLSQVMDSIRASDFPKDGSVPIIISHDGRVPEMMEYVQSIQRREYKTNHDSQMDSDNNDAYKFPIITLVHPFSCYEHPHSFPGNDTSLNVGFEGDSYGNPRSDWATCCKHHFTWMVNTVFNLEHDQLRLQPNVVVDTFFFLEEDYVVSRTIYNSIITGLNVMAETEPFTTNGYFGLAMNTSNSITPASMLPPSNTTFEWAPFPFRTGPMTMNRNVYALLKNHSHEYCTRYDDYNWDWTLYQLMRDQLLPYTVLVPWHTPLVQHIGTIGMHTVHASARDLIKRQNALRGLHQSPNNLQGDLEAFLNLQWFPSNRTRKRGTFLSDQLNLPLLSFQKASGGWSHPADHEHCLRIFAEAASK